MNSLWFLSLSISLACALLATLQQHRIYSYLSTQALQSRPSRRARMHMLRYQGIAKMSFFRISDITNALMHFPLFLFFSGLLIYLFNVNRIAFCAIVWFIVASAMIYLIVTLMPACRISGSPFSALVCQAFAAIIRWIFDALKFSKRVPYPDTQYFKFLHKIKLKGYTKGFRIISKYRLPDSGLDDRQGGQSRTGMDFSEIL